MGVATGITNLTQNWSTFDSISRVKLTLTRCNHYYDSIKGVATGTQNGNGISGKFDSISRVKMTLTRCSHYMTPLRESPQAPKIESDYGVKLTPSNVSK